MQLCWLSAGCSPAPPGQSAPLPAPLLPGAPDVALAWNGEGIPASCVSDTAAAADSGGRPGRSARGGGIAPPPRRPRRSPWRRALRVPGWPGTVCGERGAG